MMGILNMVNVKLSGLAVVRVSKTVRVPADTAKKLLANDKSIQLELEKACDYTFCEWDVVSGERSVNNLTINVGG